MITRWQHCLIIHCVSVFHPSVALSSVARDVPEYSTDGRRQTDLQEHEIHQTPGTRRVGETRYELTQVTRRVGDTRYDSDSIESETLKLLLMSLEVSELNAQIVRRIRAF